MAIKEQALQAEDQHCYREVDRSVAQRRRHGFGALRGCRLIEKVQGEDHDDTNLADPRKGCHRPQGPASGLGDAPRRTVEGSPYSAWTLARKIRRTLRYPGWECSELGASTGNEARHDGTLVDQ